MNNPILALSDMNKLFEVKIDAFDFPLGGVLLQEEHLIAYESHKFPNA